MKLNKYIDHTALKADTLKEDIIKLCNEAKKYDFASVCVNPTWVSLAKELLKDTDVKVCTVIGFPLGANTSEVKGFETKNAIENGAEEIDMVINIALLKEKEDKLLLEDIKKVVENAFGKTVKVIIETCLLTDEEKERACRIIMEAGAQFVKTSTGFSSAGATKEDIELFKRVVEDKISIKASGGVRTSNDVQTMIDAGANRIGTSGGVNIMNNEKNESEY